MLDINKPVQTRKPTDWINIEIIRTDLQGDYPIVAIVTSSDGIQDAATFTIDGRLIKDQESYSDLINVPEKHVRYMNMYMVNGVIQAYGYKSLNDAYAIAERYCIARVRVEFQEGQYDE